jgi:hypothetical protein
VLSETFDQSQVEHPRITGGQTSHDLAWRFGLEVISYSGTTQIRSYHDILGKIFADFPSVLAWLRHVAHFDPRAATEAE